MAKAAFTNPQGGCSIITAAPGVDLAKEADRIVPAGVPYSVVQDDQIPPDHIYFNSWEHDVANAAISVNMTKARNVHREYMRQARIPLMANLDAQYMIADERGKPADKLAVAAQKQALRDVTADPAIEAAQTPGDLKLVWPAQLGPNPLI